MKYGPSQPQVNQFPRRRSVLMGALCLLGCGRSQPRSQTPDAGSGAQTGKTMIDPGINPGDTGPGRASLAISGHDFKLEDGRTIRLGSIEAPRMPHQGVPGEPYAARAQAALAGLVMGHTLRFGDTAIDKFSRLRAQVFVDMANGGEPVWVQSAMLAQGMARVRTWADNAAHSAQLLAVEASARALKTGLWAEAYYAVRAPENVDAAIGSFQIVEGRIIDAAEIRKEIYLNFGANWRNDFTVNIKTKLKKTFAKAGINLNALSGVRVRARGFVHAQNGPVIYMDHPAALEILAG